jgi:hypothetical protein
MKTLTDWLDTAIIDSKSEYFTFRRRIELNNGVTLSIQGSDAAYCTPRVNSDGYGSGIYTSMEIGFPSREIELLNQYAEDPEKPTDTVYPHTPIEVIEQVVNWGGGIKGLQEREND